MRPSQQNNTKRSHMLLQCFSEDIILVYEKKIQMKMEPNWSPEAQRGSVKMLLGTPNKKSQTLCSSTQINLLWET